MKLTINGEVFEFDGRKQKVAEALAIEEAYGRRYAEWQDDMAGGGVKALCTLAWLIWRRDGRDVPLEDILSEKVELDLNELLRSLMEGAMEEFKAAMAEEEAKKADPTTPPEAPASAPRPSRAKRSRTATASSRATPGESSGRAGTHMTATDT